MLNNSSEAVAVVTLFEALTLTLLVLVAGCIGQLGKLLSTDSLTFSKKTDAGIHQRKLKEDLFK